MSTDQRSGPNSETLEARIAVLEGLFLRLAQAGATESILDHGFKQVSDRLKTVSKRLEHISKQVEPLRNLGYERPHFKPEQQTIMNNLYKALLPPEPMHEKQSQHVDESHVGDHHRSAS